MATTYASTGLKLRDVRSRNGGVKMTPINADQADQIRKSANEVIELGDGPVTLFPGDTLIVQRPQNPEDCLRVTVPA